MLPGQYYPIKLVLLCQILQQRNPSADCSVATLMKNASCFLCLTGPQLSIIRLALLCEIWKGAGQPAMQIPTPPIILSTVRGGSPQLPNITLTWQLLDSRATTTQVWVSDNGGNYFFVATIVPPFTTYTDYGQGGPGYNILDNICYQVRACNDVGCSAYSNISCQATVIPGSPTNISSPSSVVATPINVTWQLPDNLGTRVELWRNVNGGAFSALATLAAGTTSYSDNGPYTNGSRICYEVRACNSSACSAFSGLTCTTIIAS